MIPPDLVYNIFSWLPPKQALKLKRISKLIYECLSTNHFAILNVNHFFTGHERDASFLASNRAFDEMFFLAPQSYKQQCAQHLVRVMEEEKYVSLRWNDLTLNAVCLPPAISFLSYFKSLEIRKTGLTGPIPGEIGTLKNLEVLILQDNQINGCIPNEIGDLVNLKSLNLSKNCLQGEIPHSLRRLSRLVEIILEGNQLVGSLSNFVGVGEGEICDLIMLEFMNVAENQIGGHIPQGFGQLKALTHLIANGNYIEGEIPESFSQLTSLQYAVLARNRLHGRIPHTVFHMERLEYLNLKDNQCEEGINEGLKNNRMSCFTATTPTEVIQQIFSWIPPSQNLAFQRIDSRVYACLCPSHFAKMNLSRFIPINAEPLIEIPAANIYEFDRSFFTWPASYQTALVELRYASLGGIFWAARRIEGSLPPTIGKLNSLSHLLLGDNRLTGTIPNEIGHLVKLRLLELPRNALSGAIPKGLGNLVHLTYLSLNQNRLSGELPPEIGNLIHLDTLYLGGNNFTGNIPESIGNLLKLEKLHLNSNRLTGPLPDSISNLVHLQEFLCQQNQLGGPIPTGFEGFFELETLDLSRNLFIGSIPAGLERLGRNSRLRTIVI
ncbi:hypothetical protein BDR26DRAFT_705664 [Obelidium mucronatum]|nr:hypothetical protein BDR26DRAFT_705664 [Obelidium mucronatum]